MKKVIFCILNVTAILAAIAGAVILKFNSSEEGAITTLREPEYTSSALFESRFSESVNDIFDYIFLHELFEKDGKMNLQQTIAKSDTRGAAVSYSLDTLIKYARSMGFYLNEKNQVVDDGKASISKTEDERDHQIRVTWRAYMPNYMPSSPADGMMSLGKLAEETLSYLAKYYAVRSEYFDHTSNLKFFIRYYNDDENITYRNDNSQTPETILHLGKYFLTNSENLEMRSNMLTPPSNAIPLLEARSPFENASYELAAGVDTSFLADDGYYREYQLYNTRRKNCTIGITLFLFGFAGTLLSCIGLFRYTGEGKNGKILLQPLDSIPIEAIALIFFLWYYFAGRFSYAFLVSLENLVGTLDEWEFWESTLVFLLIYVVFLPLMLSLARNYKARTLWKNSLLKKILDLVQHYINAAALTSSRYFTFILFLLPNAAGIAMIAMLFTHFYQAGSLRAFLAAIAFFVILLTIDIYTWRIATGLKKAVNEQVKAERLKADLITNVSHDLKTPLTSIINYVDLLKRIKIDDPKANEYLDVLEQKSHRLKTLTEDLVEASKASSGNVSMDIVPLDYNEMIRQALGEFEDKFTINKLQIIESLPHHPVMILADGRRLWRILENLLNNCCKYALRESRIYIDLSEQEKTVTCTIKNISSSPLNISPEELTERFVRGDVSRTTEGSGLGLSIAKSLTVLMHGALVISIDGDLYKASVTLPKAELSKDFFEESNPPSASSNGSDSARPESVNISAPASLLMLVFSLCCFLTFFCHTSHAENWPVVEGSIYSEGAILIDADSGAVLFQKNEHEKYFPASITKVLTAILVLENTENLDDQLTFSASATITNLEPNSTIIGATAGDKLSVRDCLYCLLLHSANDCANALAEYVSGSNEAFAELMNQKAAELGCTDSHFMNPSGLNNPEHYTSCADMAKILQYAIQNPLFCQIEATQLYTHGPIKRYPNADAPENTVYAHHRMMRKVYREYYEGAFAGKTGYTTLAGNTLVTACRKNDMTLICVILNGHNSQYIDSKTLFDFGFGNFDSLPISSWDKSYTVLGNNMVVAGIPIVDSLELSIGRQNHLTMPKGTDSSLISSTLTYDLSESGLPDGSFARIDYYYGERPIGTARIRFEDKSDEYSSLLPDAASAEVMPPAIPENITISVKRQEKSSTSYEDISQQHQSHAPIYYDHEKGRLVLQKSIVQLFYILAALAGVSAILLLFTWIVDRWQDAIKKRTQRHARLLHARDIAEFQKYKREETLFGSRRRRSKSRRRV